MDYFTVTLDGIDKRGGGTPASAPHAHAYACRVGSSATMSGIVKSEDAIAAHHAALVDGAHFGILSRPLPCASLNTWLQPAEGAHFSNRILSAADYNRTKRGLGSSTAQPPPPSYHDVGDVGDNKAEVAAHYDRLKDRHRTLETGSEILRLRNLNNWIKSALFQKHLFRGQKGRSGPAVLDLACGKGGDMLKFRASDIATYVGVDIAANSVRDAVRRYNGMDGRPGMPFGATFMVGDFCASSISERLPAHLASTRFQVASCQFAMHYAFDTEARATALLANAAMSITKRFCLCGIVSLENDLSDMKSAKVHTSALRHAATPNNKIL